MSDPIKKAMRIALCKRLRETGMQQVEGEQFPCDGDMVLCGCCDRTIDAIEAARKSETRAEIDRQFDVAEGGDHG